MAVVKAAIAAVPAIGSPAAELVNLLSTPLAKRRDVWLNELAERVSALEREGRLRAEDLPKNEAFLDAVQHATQAALRTSQAQKRLALRNAAVNSALPGAPTPAVQQLFLGLVDTFTEWHILVLRMIAEGIAQVSDTVYASTENLRPLAQALDLRFPELKDQKEFVRQVCSDLVTRGLMKRPGLGTQDLMAIPLVQLEVTALGRQLLDFIREA